MDAREKEKKISWTNSDSLLTFDANYLYDQKNSNQSRLWAHGLSKDFGLSFNFSCLFRKF